MQPAVKRLGIKNEEVTAVRLCALHKSVCVCVFWGKCSFPLWVKWHLAFPLQLWKTNTWFWRTTSISPHVHTHTVRVSVREMGVEVYNEYTVCPLRQILKDMFMTSCLVSPCFVTRELSSLCPFSHPSAVTTFLIQSYLFSTCVKNTQKHAHNICSYFYFFVNCSV